MDKVVLDKTESLLHSDGKLPQHLAELEAQLKEMDLVSMLRLFMKKFDLSTFELGIAAEIEVPALYKILRGEHREFKSDHVESLLDDLETEGKLTDPLEREIWRRSLRIAAFSYYDVYKAVEPRLTGTMNEEERKSIISEYLRSQYPMLIETYERTQGKFPSHIPIEIAIAARLLQENSTRNTSEPIDRCFQLAYVIMGDRAAALTVAAKAAEGWELAINVQRKRVRYRSYFKGLRLQLMMNPEHVLQLLTYKLCEPLEKAQERDYLKGDLIIHEHFFIIRYIKHLLYRTVFLRSFHVTVGLCQLLYKYTTSETTQIYAKLAPEDVRLDKDFTRYAKLALFKHLEKRFPGLLTIETRPLGMTHLVKTSNQKGLAELVVNTLKLFTPWGVPCALPADLKIGRNSFQPFKFTGGHPDEHLVEEQRMCAIINPDCFSVLTHALGLDSSYDRLAVPFFTLPPGNQNNYLPPPDFSRLPHLTPDEMLDITGYLNRNRKRI